MSMYENRQLDALNPIHAIRQALFRLGPRKRSPVEIIQLDPGNEKLKSITARTHEILFETRTVWPLDLFRDSVIIDREKLTIISRYFFQVAKVVSVPIRDILNIQASVGPFFGSVRITSRYYPVNPFSVNFLLRKDALTLQRLLQGYIIVHEEEINCSNIDTRLLLSYIYDLGQGDTKKREPYVYTR